MLVNLGNRGCMPDELSLRCCPFLLGGFRGDQILHGSRSSFLPDTYKTYWFHLIKLSHSSFMFFKCFSNSTRSCSLALDSSTSTLND